MENEERKNYQSEQIVRGRVYKAIIHGTRLSLTV